MENAAVEPLPLYTVHDVSVLHDELSMVSEDDLFVKKIPFKLRSFFYIRTGKRSAGARVWLRDPDTYDISTFGYDPYVTGYDFKPKSIYIVGPCFDMAIEEN